MASLKPKRSHLLLAGFFTLLIAALIVYRYYIISQKDRVDPLCALAKSYGMSCAKLAVPSVYDHGAYVQSQPQDKGVQELVLPTDYIFSERCAFSPEATAFARFRESPDQRVNFGSHTFNVDRSLSVGVDLTIPKVAGLTLAAGPKLSEIRSVTLQADSAQYFNVDTNEFLTALGSCTVNPSCARVASSPDVHVIKRLLVAKNLKYRIETTSGESESLAAAIRSKSISLGVESSAKTVAVDDLSTGVDMVFAVSFFEPAELRNVAPCSEPVHILKVTGKTIGDANASVAGVSPDHKEELNGKELDPAHVRAPDAKDRQPGESMTDPEAQAWGLWNHDPAKRQIGLFARTLVEPGTRSQTANAKFPQVWARPRASLENQVEVTLANTLSEQKTLVASAQFIENTSISLLNQRLPPNSYFKPLTLISHDGTQHIAPPVWSSADRVKDFELGKIGPGEVVKVLMGRRLDSVANFADEGGTRQEDILISFSLK
jgi:hypothetical protein